MKLHENPLRTEATRRKPTSTAAPVQEVSQTTASQAGHVESSRQSHPSTGASDDWEQFVAPSGHYYWVNHSTGASQWEAPSGHPSAQSQAAAELPSHFQAALARDQKLPPDQESQTRTHPTQQHGAAADKDISSIPQHLDAPVEARAWIEKIIVDEEYDDI